MPKIFKEYGGVIVTVMAIVALIGVIGMMLQGSNGGWIGSAFNSVVGDTHEKAGAKIDSITAGGNSANTETLAAGLYDADGNMTMSWDEIVTAYPDAFGSDGTQINSNAYSYLSNLAGKLVINESITTINHGSLQHCASLTSIIIPDSVTYMGQFVFGECTSLTSVTIPNSVTNISAATFMNCTSLKNIHFNGTKSEWDAITISESALSGCPTITVHCTDGDLTIN